MNTMSHTDEKEHQISEKPGAQLAFLREKKGYTPEYVAEKLHLRIRLVELLEADIYDKLPQPVFVKGYIRAYAKLLGIAADPLITAFNALHGEERKTERTLWQSRREPSMHERLVRWITGLIVLIVFVTLVFVWQSNNNSGEKLTHHNKNGEVKTSLQSKGTYLTQVSKIRSLFKSTDTSSRVTEKSGD